MESSLVKIHEASLRVLEETGVRFFHPEVLRIMKGNGVKVQENIGYFSPDQIMDWIGKAPSGFKLHARNPIHDIFIGGDNTEFAPGYGAPTIIDKQGKRRPAVFQDYINFLKLVQQCPYYHINGGILVQPSDLHPRQSFPQMLYATIKYSDKCLMAGAGGLEETERVLDMLEIVFGKDSLTDVPRIMAILNSTSPLQYDRETLDSLLLLAQNGQPVIITPAAMAGSTGPVTLSGTIVQSNAEILAGIALAQMVREGTPVVYGMQSTSADMRTGGIADGSPERALCVAYGARLAKAYGLPCRGGGAETDAKSVSVQSGYESMMDLLVAGQEKMNLMIHSGGILASHGAMSYEKFIIDLEIIGMVRRFLRGIDLDEESLAVDIIKSVGPGGEYLTSDHTMKYCRREPYLPIVSARGPLLNGINPEQELYDKMEKKIDEMLKHYTSSEIPKGELSRLKSYLDSHGFSIGEGVC